MTFKDRFKKRNQKTAKSILRPDEVPLICYENELIKDDEVLKVVIGQWLGIFDSFYVVKQENWTNYQTIRPEEFLMKHNITDKEYDLIDTRLGYILTLMGVNTEEICTLDNFDKDNLSFDCELYTTGKKVGIKIKFETLDNEPEITITDGSDVRVYRFSPESQDSLDRLDLLHYHKKLDSNGYCFTRYLAVNAYKCKLQSNDNKMKINIEYPSNLGFATANVFVDSDSLENEISKLEFPINIEEICSIIARHLKSDLEEYPLIDIEITNNKNDEKVINGKATFVYNKCEHLVFTKNGITITINSDGDWDYTTEAFSAGVSKRNTYYTANNIPQPFDKSMYLPEYIDDEINSAVRLSLTLMKNDKGN